MGYKSSTTILPARLVENRLEAGADEVGRGCIAGPVVAAAVILPPNFSVPGLTDSKRLSEAQRITFKQLIEQKALAYAVAFVHPHTIDQINILQASILAMNKAIEALNPSPEFLLVDGNKFSSHLKIPYQCIVKGDAKIGSIAAASILAKVARDNYMKQMHQTYPEYGWATNVGYPTPQHLEALQKKGSTPLHRKTFKPCLLQPLGLDFDA